jgi:Protein of unknown function (DUF3300)
MTTRLPTTLFAVIAFATISWGAAAQAPQPDSANPQPNQAQPNQAQPNQAQTPPAAAQPSQPSDLQQGQPSGQQPKQLSQAELDQLVAPIALYPDPLLSNVLMASTYALDVVEAKRWLDQNKSLKGKQLKAAVDKQDWDNSVKELTATPPVLAMMSDKLDWTEKLGDAVYAQQQDVMEAVQRLRVRAQAEDKLKTTKQQKVVNRRLDNRDIIAIEPGSRSMAYVPYYDPGVVYGAWPYPAYPPYYWPGYYYGTDPLIAGLTFAAFAVGAWAIADNWWGGGFDWGRRDIFWRDGRNRHRFAHDPNRRGGNQIARNRDNRNAALNDRNNRRDRQANVNGRNVNKSVSQNRVSNRQVKRASASQRRVAQRSSINRNLARANRGRAMHFSNQRARASFAGPRGGGGRHFGGGRMGGGGGGHAARGGGRRGR